jgi:hypothetical protein
MRAPSAHSPPAENPLKNRRFGGTSRRPQEGTQHAAVKTGARQRHSLPPRGDGHPLAGVDRRGTTCRASRFIAARRWPVRARGAPLSCRGSCSGSASAASWTGSSCTRSAVAPHALGRRGGRRRAADDGRWPRGQHDRRWALSRRHVAVGGGRPLYALGPLAGQRWDALLDRAGRPPAHRLGRLQPGRGRHRPPDPRSPSPSRRPGRSAGTSAFSLSARCWSWPAG